MLRDTQNKKILVDPGSCFFAEQNRQRVYFGMFGSRLETRPRARIGVLMLPAESAETSFIRINGRTLDLFLPDTYQTTLFKRHNVTSQARRGFQGLLQTSHVAIVTDRNRAVTRVVAGL